MSESHQQTLACRACGRVHRLEVWSSINANNDPTLRKRLLKHQLNWLRCSCSYEGEVGHDLLYHDMQAPLQVWLKYPDEDGTITLDGTALDLGSALPGYTLRVVRSRSQLLEKIRIFSAGLDDRVVEVLKLLAWQEFAGDEAPARDRFFFVQRRRRGLRRHEILEFLIFTNPAEPTTYQIDFHSVYEKVMDRLFSAGLSRSTAEPLWRIVGREYALNLVNGAI